MEELCQHKYESHEVNREDDLNIEWTNNEDEAKVTKVLIGLLDLVMLRTMNQKGKFGSRSVLMKTIVDRATKCHISYIYFCRALKDGEFMSNPKTHEIVIFVAHLEVGLNF